MRQLGGRLFVALVVAALILFNAPTARADTIDTESRQAVADAYLDWLVPALKTPSSWKGNPKKCVDGKGEPQRQPSSAVGDESTASRAATFAAINYYRAMAGLKPVTENPEYSEAARQAALIMLANDDISHYPDTKWECWSRQGADAAARSNIAISWGNSDGAAARSIALYMDDQGPDNLEVGHRRWLLDSSAAEFGTGSTSRTNAVLVIPDEGAPQAGRHEAETAWPSAGYFPWEVMPTSRRWSYGVHQQVCHGSDDEERCAADGSLFDAAKVSMTRNGKTLRTKVVSRGGDAGDPALVWETAELTAPAPGATDIYRVTITGAGPEPIVYQVKVFRATPKKLSATPVPKVSGTPKVGRKLTATAGSWKPSGVALSYQWYRDGKKIPGATRSSHTLQPADAGHRISVRVTGGKSGYQKTTKASKSTRKVTAGTLKTAKPTIRGTAAVGQTFTADPGTGRPAGLAWAFQWYRDGKKIKGATQASYTVTGKDSGKRLTVKVTGKAPGYAATSQTSKATRKVS